MRKCISFFLMIFYFTLSAVSSDIELRKNDYSAGLLPLGTGYQAKLFCSCFFVMKRDEDYCRKFIDVSPKIFRVQFNEEKKTVTAKALYFFSESTAHWTGDKTGCTLLP